MTDWGGALALLLASANVTPAPAADEPQGASETEVIAGRDDGHDRMTVPVSIGEHGPYRFVIDTGSQRTVVSSELATRLALSPIQKRRIIGIAGAEIAETAVLDELVLGRRSFYDLLVLLFEAQYIGADGIVGTDSLQSQRVLIDFAANSMSVGDAKSQGGNSGFEIVVTARRRSGQLVMTDAVIDGIRTAVVIDTGSNTSVGNRALQRALGQRGKLAQAVLVSVTGQQIAADIGFAGRIAIGDINITNAVIAYTDGPVFAALDLDSRPAMMLGMRELRLFKRVAIDFTKRKVYFDLPEGF
jgi:predicted aspartyl protease